MKLTEQAVKEYIDNGGMHCPYCESDDVEAGTTGKEDDRMLADVHCRSCRRRWQDVYELKGIEEVGELGQQ